MKNENETTKHEGVPDFFFEIHGIDCSMIVIYHRGNNKSESTYQYPFYETLLTIDDLKNSMHEGDGIKIKLEPTFDQYLKQERKYKLIKMKTLQRQLLLIYMDEGMDALIEELKKMGAKEKIKETKIKFE